MFFNFLYLILIARIIYKINVIHKNGMMNEMYMTNSKVVDDLSRELQIDFSYLRHWHI